MPYPFLGLRGGGLRNAGRSSDRPMRPDRVARAATRAGEAGPADCPTGGSRIARAGLGRGVDGGDRAGQAERVGRAGRADGPDAAGRSQRAGHTDEAGRHPAVAATGRRSRGWRPGEATASLAAALLAAAAWIGPGPARAQTVSDVAVPYYTPPDFMRGLHRDVTAPRSAAFAEASRALPVALDGYCAGSAPAAPGAIDRVRAAWSAAVEPWERLAAVAIGPVIERRSIRQIDFVPTRPELIRRSVQRAPQTLADLERVGTPAKGFPALEWLLWTEPVAPGTPACRYAALIAREIEVEARTLATAYAELAEREWSEDAAVPATSEVVNQWVGGLERLRWAQIERPVREAGTTGRDAASFPRSASGRTAASWSAGWDTLRRYAVLMAPVPPPPGEGLAPLETYLRGRGINPPADKLRAAVERVDQAMKDLQPGNDAPLLAAARELAALKHLTESEIAPALEVNIGFSDADGD